MMNYFGSHNECSFHIFPMQLTVRFLTYHEWTTYRFPLAQLAGRFVSARLFGTFGVMLPVLLQVYTYGIFGALLPVFFQVYTYATDKQMLMRALTSAQTFVDKRMSFMFTGTCRESDVRKCWDCSMHSRSLDFHEVGLAG